jgi:AcrR family transcriptional regulator
MDVGKRLSADAWTAAALAALAAGGVAAVAVEPLAARLGATKGSFYWHFASREALLAATLERWERVGTEDVIAAIDGEPDLTARLRLLLAHALDGGSRVELALQPSAAHPLVAPVLARVTLRRLDYLTDLFTGLGFDPGTARERSVLAYTAYLGHAQLTHATPDAAPDAFPRYVRSVVAVLTAPP